MFIRRVGEGLYRGLFWERIIIGGNHDPVW